MNILDAPLIQRLAPSIEKTLNLALAVDPASQARLKPLAGCVLEIHLSSLSRSLFFTTQGELVQLLKTHDEPSVTLSGTPLAFVRLALTKDKQALFRNKEISLSGDAVRAQQISQFMSKVNIDWEALLAEIIGDVPAHFLGQSIRQSWSWGKHLSQSLITDIEEFIKYELRLLPNKAVAKKQFDAIDQLRLATDRLEARVKKLVQGSTQKQQTSESEVSA